MELQPGTLVLNGRYRIERLLGAGGSGEVYLVTQTSFLQGQAALKILRRGEAGVDTVKIENYRARFELEGRLQSELGTSPGIVRVFDGGDHEGSPVLVMDYMSGGTLKAEMQTTAGKGLPWQRCADVLLDASSGLQVLHGHSSSYVHRDVKPSNILLDAQGQAKIADLGVVQNEWTPTRTQGTPYAHPQSPGYASPEHAQSDAALSPAADVYALGVIGFEMLTGHLPQPSALDQPIEPIVGDTPEWFKSLITCMLAFDYRERPKTGEDVARAIREGLGEEREREGRRTARIAELGRRVDATLAAESRSEADLAVADGLVDELERLAPNEPNTFNLSRRLAKALRDGQVAPPLQRLPGPINIKPLTRRDRLRREAELREDLGPAKGEKRWADVAQLAEELLELAPDDPDATAALRMAMHEFVRHDREVKGLRDALKMALASAEWDKVQPAALALLASEPDDAEALQALADHAKELDRRRIATERKKAEAKARLDLRAAVSNKAWAQMGAAIESLLVIVPDDPEASKAKTVLRAHQEREAEVARKQAAEKARSRLRVLLAARKWDGLGEAADELLLLSPADAEALTAKAALQRELDRIAAQKRREDDLRHTLRLAVEAGHWDEVDANVRALLDLIPEDPDAIRAQAALDAENGRMKSAKLRQDRLEVLQSRIGAAVGSRDWDKVRRWVPELRELDPQDPTALIATEALRAHDDFRPAVRRVGDDRASVSLGYGVDLELVRVPAGGFQMGSAISENILDRVRKDVPADIASSLVVDPQSEWADWTQHTVDLPQFWIGRAPVTIAQFATFVEATGYKTQAEKDGASQVCRAKRWTKVSGANWSHPGGPLTQVTKRHDHPVAHIAWQDCLAFCKWASGLGLGEFVPPSEAEWEKAARGTDGRLFPWGNERPDPSRLNFNHSVDDTTPVGKYENAGLSPYGCLDMAGNVWEWTRSLHRSYPYRLNDDRESISGDDRRVLRGGSFSSDVKAVRCAARLKYARGNLGANYGFRVVVRLQSQ